MAGKKSSMEALTDRVADLEDRIGDEVRHPNDATIMARIQALDKHAADMFEASQNATKKHGALEGQINAVKTMFTDAVKELTDELSVLRRMVSVIGTDQAAAGGSGSDFTKIKVPEPKTFSGARDTKALENFMWDMDQYFKAARTPEEQKVTLVSMYLEGDAKLWWRTRTDDDLTAGRPSIVTWDVMKDELKSLLLTSNAAWLARENLRKLRHTGTPREYVKEFSSLMLDIRNMSEEDKLFNFTSGLQAWAQDEVRR